MEKSIDELESELNGLRAKVEVMSGTQVAMAVALNLMLSSYRNHPEMAEALAAELEHSHARMLANTSSDAKIEGFELIAKGLRKALEP